DVCSSDLTGLFGDFGRRRRTHTLKHGPQLIALFSVQRVAPQELDSIAISGSIANFSSGTDRRSRISGSEFDVDLIPWLKFHARAVKAMPPSLTSLPRPTKILLLPRR